MNTNSSFLSHIAQSSKPAPMPALVPHPLVALSSSLSSDRVAPICNPYPPGVPAAPINQPIHHPPPPSDKASVVLAPFFPDALSFRLPFPFLSLNPEGEPGGRELAYDSGNSAKLIRFGVEPPELVGVLLKALMILGPRNSGTGRELVDCVGEVGVGVPAGGVERFIEECLGGDGGRVEDEWVGFVNRRDTEAVAVDVPNDGKDVEGKRAGGRRGRGFFGGAGCSSRIFRRLSIVRKPSGRASDEDDGEGGSSSMQEVII
jgi:hypothetical protein